MAARSDNVVLSATRSIRFGCFELDLHSAELKHDAGTKLQLPEQPFAILLALIERPGELVTREQLQLRLWPAGTLVDAEHGLNTAVKKLRELLGDDADQPRFIETVPRRGYRLLATVDKIVPREAANAAAHPQPPRRRALVAVAVLAVIAAAVLLLRSNVLRPRTLRVIATKQLTFHGRVLIPWGFPWYAEFMPSVQSDGRRVYFISSADRKLYSVAVNSGEATAIRTLPLKLTFLLHISPDGATLLAKDGLRPHVGIESTLWLLATNGGFARPLGDVQAHDAAWFPDGKSIVFAAGNALYVTDVGGSSSSKLFDTPGRAFWIRWAPDGKRLRFTVLDPTTQARTIWEATPTGHVRRLLRNWKGGSDICCGEWTRDGRHFVFRSTRDNRTEYWNMDEDSLFPNRPQPALLSAGGLEMAAVAVSPLENRFFVTGVQLTSTVSRFDLSSGRSEPLLPDQNPYRVAFSRDGRWLTVVQRYSGERVLWRVNADGTEWRQLSVPPMVVHHARYSPDGRRIALMAKWPSHPWKIYWISAEGGALHELSVPLQNQADPNWSPDGESVMFGQPPLVLGEPSAQRAIYIHNLRTGQISRLPGSEGWFSPRWSSDGRYVAAMSIGNDKIGVFDFASQQWRELAHGLTFNNPFWSADGTWVYFSADEDDRIRRVKATGGPVQEVLNTSTFSESRDCVGDGFTPDHRLLVACGHASANVYAMEWRD